MKYLIIAGLLFLLTLGYFHPITALTQDLGRHMFTGHLILNTQAIPSSNLFSYTFPDFPVINTHWLAQVIFALIHESTGFPGLFILMLMLVVSAFILQLQTVYKKVSALSLGLAGLLYFRILFERTDLRPELFSFVFFSLFVTLLYRYREKTTNFIFLLVPLQLLWVNTHIYFAIGLIVIFLFLIDAIIIHRKDLTSRHVVMLGFVFLFSSVISLINPHGINGLLYPLHVFQNYGYTIEENQTVFLLESLGFHKPSFPYLKIGVFLLFLSLAASYKKTRPIDWMLAIVFTWLAFSATRNLPLFVFATFIPYTLYFSQLLTKSVTLIPPVKVLKQHAALLSLLLFAGMYLWQLNIVWKMQPVGYGVTKGAEKAVDFLLREHISGPIFNNFDIGSYLIYRLYPKERVFVDGRPEAYPATFFTQTYIPMQEEPELFNQVVKKYQIDTVFFSHTDQTPWGNAFLQAIVTNPDWKIVYLDDYVIILLKNTPENQLLISRYGMSRDSLLITTEEDTFEANMRIVSFLAKVGWLEQTLPYLQKLLGEDPKYCPALGLITDIYQKQQNPAAMIYGQQYTQSCR